MNPALVVRFRPAGPWRIGPDSGARNRVDRIFHSDSLFSAVSHAFARLGRLEDWLAATALNPASPAVRFSSCFPSMDDLLLIPPPRNLWPPPPSAKIRWGNARFVPLSVVAALAAEQPVRENAWFVDGPSECLLPTNMSSRGGPFRVALRSNAAVDRPGAAGVLVHETACLEFAAGGGLWTVVEFADGEAELRWKDELRAAFRLLADSGLGGERSVGWGRSSDVDFSDAFLPEVILTPVVQAAPPPVEEGVEQPPPPPPPTMGYWLLSMFSPAAHDAVDWQRGNYSIVSRGGRIESPARSGDEKKIVRMVEEGSVLVADAPLKGAAPDVAPDGFPHPVFRAGFALAVPVPVRNHERSLGAS